FAPCSCFLCSLRSSSLYGFFCYSYAYYRDLHSFPTRRSSDLNVTLIILTLSVSRLLNLLLRLVAFLLFLNPQCLASISRWITASSSWKRFCLFVCRALRSEERFSRERVSVQQECRDRKSGSAG